MKSTVLKRTSSRIVLLLPFVLLLLGVPQYASAGQFCSMNHAYPQVSNLEVVNGQLVAILGSYFSAPGEVNSERAQLILKDDGIWIRSANTSAPKETYPLQDEECLEAPIDEDWVKDHWGVSKLGSGFEQHIASCTTDGKSLWGGISFYSGEGYGGVGGIIERDLESDAVNYYRPYGLTDYSTSHLQYFENQLWIGTAHYGECTGQAPGYGLKRIDLTNGYLREVPEVCGFAVQEVIVHDNALWVATELGLARLGMRTGEFEWQNFVPDLDDPRLMRPVSCDGLYKELLNSPRIATDTAFDMGYAFEDFWKRLTKLRPEFVSRYLRGLHGHDPAIEPTYQ